MVNMLFIGGPWDGLIRPVEYAAQEWCVAPPLEPCSFIGDMRAPVSATLTYTRYYRAKIADGEGGVFEVFTTEPDGRSLIAKLLKGYARPE